MAMDSDLWNSFTLPPPPVLSYKLICDNPEVVVNRLLGICDAVCRVFRNVHSVNAEAAVLSRIIYRMKLQFRNDKGFKTLQKLNRVVRNTLVIDTNGVFSQIQGTLENVYGPTRQMLEYTLITLQSLAKLFDRIYNVCLEAGIYFRQRLKTGHMWGIALLILSVVSRLWVLSQYIVRSACRWYNQLFQFLDMLQPTLKPWLPNGYHLPDDLYDWLGRPLYVTENRQNSVAGDKNDVGIPSTSKIAFNEDIGIPLTTELTFDDDTGVPLISSESFFKSHHKTNHCKGPEQEKTNGSLLLNHERESKQISSEDQVSSSSVLQTKEDIKKHSLSKIKSHSDLIQFIRTEKKLQKLKRSKKITDNSENMITKFYTKDMDKLQINMFNKEIKTYLKELKMIKGDEKKEAALIKTVKKRIKLWVK